MSLRVLVADDDIGWFEISVYVALRVDTVQSVHELQSNHNHSLDLEFAFLERFFQLLQIDAQQLHNEIIIILI